MPLSLLVVGAGVAPVETILVLEATEEDPGLLHQIKKNCNRIKDPKQRKEKTYQEFSQAVNSYLDKPQDSGLTTVMLAMVIDIGNSIKKLEKSILSGFKDRKIYARTNRHRIENRHRIRVVS